MGTLNIEPIPGGVVIEVKIVPGSSRDQIVGPLGGALKVKVAAPPEGGKANRAVCDLLAGVLGVARNQVEVIAGLTTPRKRIVVRGISAAEAACRLSAPEAPGAS